METLRFKPYGYWTLDNSSPFTDYSGYSRTTSRTGTEEKGIGLISNAQFSQILDSTKTITFDSPVFKSGLESLDFSLIASIFPIAKTTKGDQQILSNSGRYDGLSINGTVVSFSTKYLTTGEARASYDLRYYRRADLVGVHTKTKNSLYVNGALVAEVDITPAQQLDLYDAPDSNLYSGNTSSSQRLMINSVGIYPRPLTSGNIITIYSDINNRMVGSPARAAGGTELPVSRSFVTPYLNVKMDSANWLQGQLRNSIVTDSKLSAEIHNSLTLAGTWQKSFDLYNNGVPTPIKLLAINWVGSNVTVETSVDSVTWVTAQPGIPLTNFPNNFDPTDKSLNVRITFTPDQASAYIDDFNIVGYINSTFTPIAGMPLTVTNVLSYDDKNIMDLREDNGSKLISGTLAWGADTTQSADPVRTVEVWIKKNDTTSPTFSFTPSTTYVDGSAGGTSGQGEWALYHLILPADATTFSISGNITVGKVATYPTALSASAIASIYTNYVGVPLVRNDGSMLVQIAESPSPLNIYAHDWSISVA